MGNTWTIVKVIWDGNPKVPSYTEETAWQGENFVGALLALRRVKKQHGGCVRLEWR